MRFAFYVDTPLQLMNCVNFVWNNIENTRGNGDLYLLRVHEQYPNVLAVLRQEKLFKNVILCNEYSSKDFIHDITRTIELLIPERAVKNYTNGGIYQKNYYDAIVASFVAPLVVGMKDLNRNAAFWLYDDGAGSYYGNFLSFCGSAKTRFFYKLFKKGVEGIRPERLYINNIALCQTVTDANVIQLPKIKRESSLEEVLARIFGCEEQTTLSKNLIFLSQPFDEIIPHTSKEILNAALDYLKLYHYNETIVRKHPREQGQDYRGLDVAKSNPMWELFCMTALSEEQILISFFSTAQLTPKLLFDKEPKLIFLYDMMPTTLGDQRLKEIDAFVRNIRDSYRDKNRIHVPKTMQEFMEIL